MIYLGIAAVILLLIALDWTVEDIANFFGKSGW